MTRETWFLAVKNEHGGQRRALLITNQLHGDQVQLLVKALARLFPRWRFLPTPESELDAVDVLEWRQQCRDANARQRVAPVTRTARRSEPASDSEIRTIRATADRIITDIVARAAEQGMATPGADLSVHPSKVNPTETDWRDVQRRLLELYERAEAFPTYRDLAMNLDCSVATIRKAIKPTQAALGRLDDAERKEAVSTAHKLAGWQARHTKASPRASSLTEFVMDNAEQTREADPAEDAEAGDVDTVFARLIQEAQPEERARLNTLTIEQRLQMVALLRKDPDTYDRVLGRTP